MRYRGHKLWRGLHLADTKYEGESMKLLSIVAVMTLFTFDIGAAQNSVPNMSGSWQKDKTRSESVAQPLEVAAEAPFRLVINQSATQLTIERHRDGQTDTLTYVFNAVPSQPTVT